MKYDLELVLDERNALSLILKQILKNTVVLEFGSANGRMTKYLKEKLNCEVYIVEIDKEAALDAMRYAKDGIVGDIEKFEWLEKWETIQFDYILFADVLEHLHEPQNVLERTKQILKDNGKVILSVPNVAHNSLMIHLFNNVFNYTSLGLLDNTHIHLFAYNTLKEFCHYAGYFPIIEDAVYSNVGDNEVMSSYYDISKDAVRALKKKKYGHVYEFVFTLQKEEYIKFNLYQSEYKIKSYNPSYFFKIYLDFGNGWSEDNCITYKTDSKFENRYELSLEKSEEIAAIRIDPLDVNGIFKIKKIGIEDENGRIEYHLKDCICNGKVYKDFLFSFTDDPQIILDHFKFNGRVKLEMEYDTICAEIDTEFIQYWWNTFYVEREKESKEKEDNIHDLESCIELQKIELEKRSLELEHRMEEINKRDSMIQIQENENKLKEEELIRRDTELLHRMDEINEINLKGEKLKNEIKQKEEELDRRQMELIHRMDEINKVNLEKAELENETKLKGEELDRRQKELDHRMDEINRRNQEIANLYNEVKLKNEELDRRNIELDLRMKEINIRDKKIAELKNKIKLSQEELDRRQIELKERMEKINHCDREIADLKNEIKLKEEELIRRSKELDLRMEEINIRDQKIAEQENKIKLKDQELERREKELIHRMEEINKLNRKIAEQSDEIKIKDKELERKRLELENYMEEMNRRDLELADLENEISLKNKGFIHKQIEFFLKKK